MQKCELLDCRSDLEGTIGVNENIGDGSWLTWICQDCAEKLDLKDGDDLPDRITVWNKISRKR